MNIRLKSISIFMFMFILLCSCVNEKASELLHISEKNDIDIITIKNSEKIKDILLELNNIKYNNNDYQLLNKGAEFKIWLDKSGNDERNLNLYFWKTDSQIVAYNTITEKYGLLGNNIFDSIIEKHIKN
jgi:hypothetical protein